MKHFVLLLASLLATAAFAGQTTTTLHTAAWTCGDNWTGTDNFVAIYTNQLTGLAAGDIIAVEVSSVSQTDQWPQVWLSYADASWNWHNFGDTEPRQALLDKTATMPYTAQLVLSQTMVDLILAGQSLNVTGSGYVGASIKWIHNEPDAEPGHIDTLQIWSGREVIAQWDKYVMIEASKFDRAAPGDVVTIHIAAFGTVGQACLNLQNGSWASFNPAQQYWFKASDVAPLNVDFSLSQQMLSAIRSTGYLILNGTYYTVDKVSLQIKDEAFRTKVTVPVHHNWVFEAQEQPEVKVTLRNPADAARTTLVSVAVKTDKKAAVLTKDTTISAATGASEVILPLALTDAGIYEVNVSVDGNMVKAFNMAVRPTEIVSAPDMQSDFLSFWADTKAALAQVAPCFTLTEIKAKSTAARKVYLLEFRSLKDKGDTAAIARAYWAVPTDGKRHKTTIHFQGYDSGGYDPWCPSGDENSNECDLILSTRGQLINNRAPYANNYGDWFAYGFDSRDHWYYRGAFCDAIRALDFVWQQAGVDTTNVYAEGQSQGGALTYAAAALGNHPFNAIAPAIPFMGDWPDYFQVAQWPAYVATTQRDALSMTDAEMYRMLSYFDTKNLATLVTCPVIECLGLQDNVCPPHTNLAPYNNLSVEKEIHYNAELLHQTASNWYEVYRTFFARFANRQTDLPSITAESDVRKTFDNGQLRLIRGSVTYDALGRRIN